MSGLNDSEDKNIESTATDSPQEEPENTVEPGEDAETTGDTQERSDAIASEESQPEDETLMANEPADEVVEGQPDEGETEVPQDALPSDEAAEEDQTADDSEDDEAVSASEDDQDEDEDDEDESDEQASTEAASTDGKQPERRRRSGYQRGEIIEVKIAEVSPTSVIVELDERGEGFTGLIPSRELDRMSGDMIEQLKPGETVKLYVVNTGNPRGEVVLSLNRALEELDWQSAEEYSKSREIYDGVIAGYNKGGLIVRFGRLRGFVPQSQISDERRARMEGETPEARWSDMVKEAVTVKVIEVERSRNRLILSERAAARETRESRKAKLIEELTMNEVREGRVVSLEDFGAFVDIGGAEGLIHLTELSWGHVTHPKQVLEVGQEIKVEVISIDPQRKRIGLSLRRQLPDPWDVIASNYQQGQLVKAEVTKLTKFGAFAQLVDEPDVEGLIHISELSDNRVSHPREVVQVGETLTLRIVKIDVADRRLGLSLKRVNSTEYLDSDMDYLFE